MAEQANIVLGETNLVWAKVSVPVMMDNGRTHHITFEAQLKRPGKTRVREILKSANDEDSDFSDADLLDEMLTNWRKVKGIAMPDDSEPVFSDPDQRDMLMEFIGVEPAIVLAWFQMIRGGKAKN